MIDSSSLYTLVQDYIDDLKKNHGFDYIIAIYHMTDSEHETNSNGKYGYARADTLIKNTSGLDVVIPGHFNKPLYPSGSSYKSKIVKDKSNRNVMIAAEAGACMENIGRLKINLKDNNISSRLLIKLEDLKEIL